ncbi:MAG: DUF4743 domain-containing protein [Azospirillum sp.]|nr:DUF4743 domain-containing protein [Azospirillum sp.]
MAYLDHIRRCNRHDLAGFRRFQVAGRPVGWVRHALAERLAEPDLPFLVTAEQVILTARPDTPEGRSAALHEAVVRLVEDGVVAKLRGETYPVLERWGAPPLLWVDRSAVAHFGIAAYGIHVNGFVRRPDGSLAMWIARRSLDRSIEPGKLDNLVAGGQPIGLGLMENLVKEASEEAGIDEALARQAVSVGALSYVMESDLGLKPDTLFLYDLELPPSFEPRNLDGEVDSFTLWPLAEVAASVCAPDSFKFNCGLVVIDFLIRHGFLGPDQPDYLDLVKGLHLGPGAAGPAI